MSVDLHTHSTASDGSDPPGRIVELAEQAGLTAVALTDHDTMEGVEAARAVANTVSVELVPGVELSLDHEPGAMHLIVLWLDPGPGPLQDRLAALQAGRTDRNLRVVEILTELGMPVTVEEVEKEAGGGSVGRPHIAAVMMARGHVPDIRTAFDVWLGKGKPHTLAAPVSTRKRRWDWHVRLEACRCLLTPTLWESPPRPRWLRCSLDSLVPGSSDWRLITGVTGATRWRVTPISAGASV
jgi:3',5'-nucleoside bisphosphate phosphatase